MVYSAKSDSAGTISQFTRKKPLVISHSGALTAYQKMVTVTYEPGMLSNFGDIRFSTKDGTYISYWIEKKTDGVSATVWFKADFVDGDTTVWMYYGNAGLSSGSSGADTFIQWRGATSTEFKLSDVVSVPFIFEVSAYRSSDVDYLGWGALDATAARFDNAAGDQMYWGTYHSEKNLNVWHKVFNNGVASDVNSAPGITAIGTRYRGKIVYESSSKSTLYFRDNAPVILTTNLPDAAMGLAMSIRAGSGGQDWSFIRKYTATEPTYTIGAAQQAMGTANITASVSGDSNTQSYNTSQSRAFTLTPTGTTNNVVINTTSTDYDITITTYWTEDTTLQSETATAGYAKQYINYTPAFDITSADLNTTFTFVFADQDYIGTATSTLNDVSKPTTRAGQDINASVGSLTANTSYLWNITVPYNNIFTLSDQTNYTSNLRVAVSFTDSDYSDPEGLAIDSRLWNFGDGNTSTASNPIHNYSSEGTYTANYTVTETATVSPQTITKEFSVIILPPVYTISGYVFDTNSNPLGLALISNNQTAEEVYTNISGYYILSDLYPGSILINATKSSFSNNSIISNVVDTNLYNQNITMTAFEITDWEIYQLLLEIQEQLDVEDFDPTEGNYEMLSSTYNIFLVLLGACFVLSFPKRGEVTERDTGLNNVLFSFIGTILSMFLAQIIVSGQVVESFAFQSQIYDPLQHYLLYFVAIIMFVIFILNVLYYARQRWE